MYSLLLQSNSNIKFLAHFLMNDASLGLVMTEFHYFSVASALMWTQIPVIFSKAVMQPNVDKDVDDESLSVTVNTVQWFTRWVFFDNARTILIRTLFMCITEVATDLKSLSTCSRTAKTSPLGVSNPSLASWYFFRSWRCGLHWIQLCLCIVAFYILCTVCCWLYGRYILQCS